MTKASKMSETFATFRKGTLLSIGGNVMKSVITIIGTSIFNNYYNQMKRQAKNEELREIIDHLRLKDYSQYKSYQAEIALLKQKVGTWLESQPEMSAEIKSLEAIKKNYRGVELQVYLIATDSILSPLAAEIIKNVVKEKLELKCIFNPQNDVIRKLQIWDYKSFRKEGLPNLVNRVYQILISHYAPDLIFNITSGFKALIPYMSIIAQINGCHVVYIFEMTDTLIRIPPLPLSIDYEIFDNNYEIFEILREGVQNYTKLRSSNYSVFSELEKHELVEVADDDAILSPIGEIFFQNYCVRFFPFYATDEVVRSLQSDERLLTVFKDYFSNAEIRASKTCRKRGHYVYDHGDNPYRIFYLMDARGIYVYKAFKNHDEYEEYLRAFASVDAEEVKQRCRRYKIDKKNGEITQL